MSVKSQSLYGEPPPKGRDWSMLLIKLGGWLAVTAFGGLFWLVNGGFSVQGLEVMALGFGDGGRIFWEAASAIKLPFALQPAQPLMPWLGVVAASAIQIGLLWRALQGRPLNPWMIIVGLLLSLYDYATTFFGLGRLQWVAAAGWILQLPLAILFTFGLEGLVGYLLRKSRG